MQKIVPHLWFDKEAKQAAEFYTTLFPDSKITNITTLPDTPSGDADIVSFELWNQKFMAISAGPLFKFNPSLSFMVNFDPLLFGSSSAASTDATEALDALWNKLIDGGTILMPLDKYPFSERFGWVQDKFGLSWQLILSDPGGDPRPAIIPFVMFVGDNYGKAEEAMNFYVSVFKNAKAGAVYRYGPDQQPDKEGNVMFGDFMLEDTWFAITESAHDHKFEFNESLSFIVTCKNQEELDYYWYKLSAVPEAEQCGWLKDKYGLSWQIVPADMDDMMRDGTPGQIDRLTKAFLPMKKFDIAALRAAYEGK